MRGTGSKKMSSTQFIPRKRCKVNTQVNWLSFQSTVVLISSLFLCNTACSCAAATRLNHAVRASSPPSGSHCPFLKVNQRDISLLPTIYIRRHFSPSLGFPGRVFPAKMPGICQLIRRLLTREGDLCGSTTENISITESETFILVSGSSLSTETRWELRVALFLHVSLDQNKVTTPHHVKEHIDFLICDLILVVHYMTKHGKAQTCILNQMCLLCHETCIVCLLQGNKSKRHKNNGTHTYDFKTGRCTRAERCNRA